MKKEKKAGGFPITSLITVVVLLIILTMLGGTGWFVSQTILATDQTGQDNNLDVEAERLNTALLNQVDQNLKTKTEQPMPDSNSLRNPFLIETPPPAPTPTPEPPPTEEAVPPTTPEIPPDGNAGAEIPPPEPTP
ncbi:MAG: hypothetical protein PHT12_01930 [Patescibacteria group bacterium]|nr:hypothetical protein [Patescibacteria group bacterium]